MLIFGLCFSDNLKWVSRTDSLLEADFGSLVTHFRFGCPYGSLVGDSLKRPSKKNKLVGVFAPVGVFSS
jgi:hypothetical protein